jgi:type II secretory pathway predicted ATPase ExeA
MHAVAALQDLPAAAGLMPPAPPPTEALPLLGMVTVRGLPQAMRSLDDLRLALHLTQGEVARWLRLPRTSAHRLLTEGKWPARMPPEAIHIAARTLVKRLTRDGLLRHEVARVVQGTLPPEVASVEVADPMNPRKTNKAAQGDGAPGDDDDDPLTPEEPPMLMAKQTLTPAARKAFRLFANPFDGEVQDDNQMFTNGEIAYVREACLQAAVGGRFVAVVSESGGGKTTMLGDLESRLQRDRKPVLVIKPWVLGMEDNDTRGKTLKSADILSSIVTTLDPLAVVPQTLQARSNKAKDLLVKSTEAGYSHLLVIEEAHSLPEATMKHLKRLHEMRLGRKPLLGILLLGQTELAMKLDPRRASLREVTQRCEVVHLLPLDGDLQAYLGHRAQAAERRLEEFIDASGIDEIRARLTVTRHAGGKSTAVSLLYPLAVNNLMTAALNVAAELGVPMVNRDVVRGV